MIGASSTNSLSKRVFVRVVSFAAFIVIALAAATFAFGKPSPRGNAGLRADLVVVSKSAHTLKLFREGKLIKTFQVSLGRGGPEPKLHAGDNRVPEGSYRIVAHNAHSAFYRSLRIGYPTAEQSRKAQAAGIDAGGDVMIHGLRNGLGWIGPAQRLVDWTRGCIAVTDAEMDELWLAIPDGTPIVILHS